MKNLFGLHGDNLRMNREASQNEKAILEILPHYAEDFFVRSAFYVHFFRKKRTGK